MAKINLLPWREERREALKREFFGMLVFAALIGMLLSGGVYSFFNARLKDQLSANQLIEFQKKEIENSLRDIGDLDKRKDELEARRQAVNDLQSGRAAVVHYFDDLVKAVPIGDMGDIYFTEVSRSGDQFSMKGKARNPNVVSEFLRNLENSPWYKNAFMTGFTQSQNQANPAVATAAVASLEAPSAAPKPLSAVPLPEEAYGAFELTVSVEASKVANSQAPTSGLAAAPPSANAPQ